MGEIKKPLPVKLFIGMLSPELDLFASIAGILSDEYGEIDMESDILSWDTTEYYREELGTGIYRTFIFFKKTIDPGALSQIKIHTNKLETDFSVSEPRGSRRRINIDPGYVTEAKVVLASTKDFAHRLYIGNSIYAEVTLKYSSTKSSFVSLDHTYFDFRTEGYKKLFNTARNMLRIELNRSGKRKKKSK